MKIKRLDMHSFHCPICHIFMIREEDEVKCTQCGFTSPILLVRHKAGYKPYLNNLGVFVL